MKQNFEIRGYRCNMYFRFYLKIDAGSNILIQMYI